VQGAKKLPGFEQRGYSNEEEDQANELIPNDARRPDHFRHDCPRKGLGMVRLDAANKSNRPAELDRYHVIMLTPDSGYFTGVAVSSTSMVCFEARSSDENTSVGLPKETVT
jgi:hypothetical protein